MDNCPTVELMTVVAHEYRHDLASVRHQRIAEKQDSSILQFDHSGFRLGVRDIRDFRATPRKPTVRALRYEEVP